VKQRKKQQQKNSQDRSGISEEPTTFKINFDNLNTAKNKKTSLIPTLLMWQTPIPEIM